MEDKGEKDKKENEVESMDENVVTLTETADKNKQRKKEKDNKKEDEKQVL